MSENMTRPIDWFALTMPRRVVATRAYVGPAMLADMSRTTTPVFVPSGKTAARPVPARARRRRARERSPRGRARARTDDRGALCAAACRCCEVREHRRARRASWSEGMPAVSWLALALGSLRSALCLLGELLDLVVLRGARRPGELPRVRGSSSARPPRRARRQPARKPSAAASPRRARAPSAATRRPGRACCRLDDDGGRARGTEGHVPAPGPPARHEERSSGEREREPERAGWARPCTRARRPERANSASGARSSVRATRRRRG